MGLFDLNQQDPNSLAAMLAGLGAAGPAGTPTQAPLPQPNMGQGANMMGQTVPGPAQAPTQLAQRLSQGAMTAPGAGGGGAIPDVTGGITNPDIAGSTAGATMAGQKAASTAAGSAMSWMDKAMPWLMALQVLGGQQQGPSIGGRSGGGVSIPSSGGLL